MDAATLLKHNQKILSNRLTTWGSWEKTTKDSRAQNKSAIFWSISPFVILAFVQPKLLLVAIQFKLHIFICLDNTTTFCIIVM